MRIVASLLSTGVKLETRWRSLLLTTNPLPNSRLRIAAIIYIAGSLFRATLSNPSYFLDGGLNFIEGFRRLDSSTIPIKGADIPGAYP